MFWVEERDPLNPVGCSWGLAIALGIGFWCVLAWLIGLWWLRNFG